MQKLIPLVCLILGGCGFRISTDPLTMAQPPSVITEECSKPVKLSGTSAQAVESDWKKDRAALVLCGYRHKQQTEWYAKRDSELVK